MTDLLDDICTIVGDTNGTLRRAIDEHQVEHLDFDPTCIAKRKRDGAAATCGRPADFWGKCSTDTCHGADGFICSECVTLARQIGVWHCLDCGIEGTFDEIHTLVPIGGT